MHIIFPIPEKNLSSETFHIAWELLFPSDNKKASQGSLSKKQTCNI